MTLHKIDMKEKRMKSGSFSSRRSRNSLRRSGKSATRSWKYRIGVETPRSGQGAESRGRRADGRGQGTEDGGLQLQTELLELPPLNSELPKRSPPPLLCGPRSGKHSPASRRGRDEHASKSREVALRIAGPVSRRTSAASRPSRLVVIVCVQGFPYG